MSHKVKTLARKLFPQRFINLFFHLPQAVFWTLFYRFPAKKMTVIGVTGTDGKTTTATLLWHILNKAGARAGLVTTVEAKIGKKNFDTGLHVTTPQPRLLQKFYYQAKKEGTKYMVVEATSHGLDQYRLWGSYFYGGILTNITAEHLDYHQTYQRLVEAKAKLFKNIRFAVLNKDDYSFRIVKSLIESQKKPPKIITYSLKKEADFNLNNFSLKTSLPGDYNLANCLAAAAAASFLGVEKETILQAIAGFRGVTGRLDPVREGQNFDVYIDFAHTPNALKNVLSYLRKEADKKSGRLIVVFGAAGLRDRQKRPLMGQVAAQLANISILTAEDPRTESVDDIIDQISRGSKKEGAKETKEENLPAKIDKKHYFLKIPNRGEAIKAAVKIAQKNDIVVICGKGHEKSMCFGTTEYPWSDQEEAKKAIKNL
ncbi:UDP-N-acetylmuramoyl-L-alanyl-D-glutamate--2,6-diaminopimelate ligase [Candidatus Shapirobacteria bacterium]|nr:UDP-N-acetylmuramoyl-L-alanyl-D-glutamate--2,6-diaminopimelate ligase [Candidatus Shapirobacteria bacterium]